MVTGIVMASGLSTRMGRCKLLLKYKGEFLIEYALDAVNKSNLDEKIVVTGNETIIDLAEDRNLKVVRNLQGNIGQSQSIKLGLKVASEISGYAFITGDQPFLSENLINKLIEEFEENPDKFIVPVYKGRRGNPVIFPPKYRNELLSLNGDIGGRIILKNHEEDIHFVEIDEEYFLWDIDTEKDYTELLQSNYY
jgi:molybdenum cofactor cytidylyltransferase